ncbi:MAG: VCBS repeat-containing protein [Candidatus Kapabacteria bacterium]|nr:VCBS repeat-containing protein [Candidatus Kapabacteria bacterium]
MKRQTLAFLLVFAATLSVQAQLFEKIDPSLTGVSFRNEIIESDSFNVLVDFYAYNGGGVGLGDLDGDGLLDLVLTSTSNGIRYYRNMGAWKFEDVTASHGLAIEGRGINTGVLIADLNSDGRLDVYVCRRYDANRLFINNGNGTFIDRSEGSALAVRSFSTMATVLDYDRDGDLDVFLVNSGEPRRKGYLNPGVPRILDTV